MRKYSSRVEEILLELANLGFQGSLTLPALDRAQDRIKDAVKRY